VILWVQQVNVVSHSPPRSIPKNKRMVLRQSEVIGNS
jgi:hypothetical protein